MRQSFKLLPITPIMKHTPRFRNRSTLFTFGALLLLLGSARARNDGDTTLAPYFVVTGNPVAEGQEEPLSLKSTSARVSIVGTIAEVEITQHYHNTGNAILEAVYLFPCSTRAAVHGLTMKVGERTVKAEIQEKGLAKATYDQAKKEGKSAALLEQLRPNVFQMSVGHLLPGDEIEVTLLYSELLVPEDRVYEFAFPTVVGPRYSNNPGDPAKGGGREWVANPYLAPGTATPAGYTIAVDLRTGLPLKDITCQTHAVKVEYTAPDSAKVRLTEESRSGAGDHDFVIRYRLADTELSVGLLTQEDASTGEGTFLLMAEPPARPRAEDIPARDYIFVLDVSGSMCGFPLATAKSLIHELAAKLTPRDHFDMVLFAGTSDLLSPTPLPATPENLRKALEFVDHHRADGGTELTAALQTALGIPPCDEEGISRSIVVVTDGYVSFERETFDTVVGNLGKANLFAFGIGSSVNRYCIEGLARAGQGEPFMVLNPSEAPAMASRLAGYLSSPVLTDVKLNFDGWQVSDLEPAVLPDLFADRPLTMIGKYRGTPPRQITLTGISGNRRITLPIDVATAIEKAGTTGQNREEIPRLWARTRIARLDDYAHLGDAETVRGEVTALGLKYGLTTRFTSFVAVDTLARPAPSLTGQTVKQPLPLPAGVPASAVGGTAGGTTPEPGLLTLLFGGVTAWWARRRRQSTQA